MSVELPLSHEELSVIRNRVRCSAEAQYTVWWELLVREAQRAAVDVALERAAQECEAQISGSDYQHLARHGHWNPMAQSATNCAAAIRALGEQHD